MAEANRIYLPTFHFDPSRECYCGSDLTFGLCCGTEKKDREAPKGIFIEPNFVSPSNCKQLVRFLEKQKRTWVTAYAIDPKTKKEIVIKHPDRVTQSVNPKKKAAMILELVRKALKDVVAPKYGAQVESFEPPTIMRYPPGGRFAVHADGEVFEKETHRWFKNFNRDVSFLLYLNDDYIGGELYYPGLNYRLKPKAGDLICFPSTHLFQHESTPIESGVKYAVVSWMKFMGTQRVSSDNTRSMPM